MNSNHKSIGWRLAGMVFGPVFLFSGWLFFTRWPTRFDTGVMDWAALAISSLAGAALIAVLPATPVLRTIAALVYVPLIGVFLFFYGLYFVGMVFGDWL